MAKRSDSKKNGRVCAANDIAARFDCAAQFKDPITARTHTHKHTHRNGEIAYSD